MPFAILPDLEDPVVVAMPYVLVSSNVAASSVELVPAMAQISKALSAALDKPEQKVMVQLNLDAPMLFQASDEVRHHADLFP